MVLCGCATSAPETPYPAFRNVDALFDSFIATIPGVRAKQFSTDQRTRRSSNRVDLPRDWTGTTGGAPGSSVEILVLEGKLMLADIELGPGGYAYVPAGSMGFRLESEFGARILWLVNDTNPASMIRTPIILDSNLVDWQATDVPGLSRKILREDPGSGERVWLEKTAGGVALPWMSSTAAREGFLVSGTQQYTECVNGTAISGEYLAGGYFLRPPNTMHGGPGSSGEATWLMRELAPAQSTTWPACGN